MPKVPTKRPRSIRASCEPLPSPDDVEEFGAYFDRFADAKVILLGEATHGTSQFYRARAAITRRLIERHGFNIVAVEADWPDAARIDRYVRHRAHEPSSEEAFTRFPTWMWRNVEMHDFIDWLRGHNEKLPLQARTRFCGLDIYSLGTSIAAVLAYLDRVDPEEAKRARESLWLPHSLARRARPLWARRVSSRQIALRGRRGDGITRAA